jgi:hypothetical protein
MVKKITLIIDAVINLILGVLLLAFNPHLSSDLGIPGSNTDFYPNILGGVFIGITLALIIETFRKKEKEWVGLGLIGAICINICGGLVLTLWLISGRLTLPLKGEIVLWALALVLLVISLLELLFSLKIIRRGSE